MQKTIFITGASAGLGKATAKLFQSKGWNVIATMRNPAKETELSQLENVTILPLDITKPAQITETANKALALGNVDVVLNNAAVGLIGPLEAVSEDQLIQQIDTNLLGAVRVTQAFIPYFRERKSGTFINITSMAGLVTVPLASLYHTVKFGLQGFSEGLSYELSRFGIAVKTVAPGYIRTAFGNNGVMVSAEPYNELMDKYMGVVKGMMNPETSGQTPEEVAQTVYEAATDGKDQLLYASGEDSKNLYKRRLQIGTEASRKEMDTLFLGN
jgi:NAD(P)-dependent dehydrogenase (short-subunit alcohol dehydrogenase family)